MNYALHRNKKGQFIKKGQGKGSGSGGCFRCGRKGHRAKDCRSTTIKGKASHLRAMVSPKEKVRESAKEKVKVDEVLERDVKEIQEHAMDRK